MIASALRSIMAGWSICIASMVYINVGGGVAGAILFSAGLLLVLTRKYTLYTGAIGYLDFSKPMKDIAAYAIVFAFNLVGCLPAVVFYHPYAVQVLSDKLSAPLWLVLVKGILCGYLIYVAVECAKNARMYMVPVCVTAFILAGGEHCIADFCYACMAHRMDVRTLVFLAVVTLGNSIGSILTRRLEQYAAHSEHR